MMADVRRKLGAWVVAACIAALSGACGAPESEPLPPGCFAFGVFGDGPYRAWEEGRFRRLIRDVNRADLEWLVHVGDIFWYPCSDDEYRDRLGKISRIRHPVVYTPGDNEWTDCHEEMAGRYAPLERLRLLRETFFPEPTTTLGGRAMAVESQAVEDAAFGEFVENARWRRGGFLFVTVHVVGSDNATEPFPGRTEADDDAQERRNQAALAWLDEAFAVAASDSLKGVVVATHANPGLERESQRYGYEEFTAALEAHATGFAGPVLLIHGDSHTQRVDHPLADWETGDTLANFTRLETFGSPDIGWVRVVVDTVAGRVVQYEPRRIPKLLFW